MKKPFLQRPLLSLTAALVLLLALSGPLSRPLYAAIPEGGREAGQVLERHLEGRLNTAFDASHKEIFSASEEGPLNYSTFYRSLKEFGRVTENAEPVTDLGLSELDVYVIAGPSEEFKMTEIQALVRFVHDGGNLLVLLHVSRPVARLTEAFGITVSNFVVNENRDTVKGESRDFYVTRFTAHPVTGGLERVAVFGTWGLLAERGGAVVAETSPEAWADLNRNRAFDEGEPTQAFGIIAAKEYGRGKVVIVADDAPFANAFINVGDNRALVDNVIRWFMEKDALK